MRRTLLLLIPLALAACESDPPAEVLNPTAIIPIGGNLQVDAVATTTGAALQLAGAGVDNVLEDTIISQLTGDTVAASGSLGSLPTGLGFGLSLAMASDIDTPEGTVVEYTVLAEGCGAPINTSVTPDTLAQTRTLWELPGARANLTGVLPVDLLGWYVVEGDSVWAALCTMREIAKIADEFIADSAHHAYFEPGPATSIGAPAREVVWLGDTLHLAQLVTAGDQYGNPLPPEWVAWDADTLYAPTVEMWDTLTASLDGASHGMEVLALREIAAGWTYELRCVDGVTPFEPEAMDSLIIQATVDSLETGGESTMDGWGVGAHLHVTHVTKRYYASGEVKEREPIASFYPFQQKPGEVQLWSHVSGGGPGYFTMTLNADSTAYTTTGRCGAATQVIDELRAPEG